MARCPGATNTFPIDRRRALHLFNAKTIKRHVDRADAPDPAKAEILRQWANTILDRSIETQSETEIEDLFKQRIVCDVLGYVPFNHGGVWTVASKAGIGSGAVDPCDRIWRPVTVRLTAPILPLIRGEYGVAVRRSKFVWCGSRQGDRVPSRRLSAAWPVFGEARDSSNAATNIHVSCAFRRNVSCIRMPGGAHEPCDPGCRSHFRGRHPDRFRFGP